LCTASLLILSGCGASPKPKDEPVIDTTLPIVKLTENGTLVDMNAIAFEWQNIKDPRVKGVYIYKQQLDLNNTVDDFYESVDSRFVTHYVDTKVIPDTRYSYYFKTFSDEAESSSSDEVVVNSLPVLESVSWIHSIAGMPRSAKLIWRPHTNQKVKAYIIERKTLEEELWKKVNTVDGRLSAEYIDKDLKDNYTYKYRVRVLTYDKIVSTPSEIVKIVTKALPLEIKNIQATNNLPKEIKITWNKSNEKDFDRYYVYRSKKVESGYELIAKLYNNLFVDKIDKDAQQYFYRVSSVDKDGLESKHDELSIQGVTLKKPTPPALVEAKLINNKIKLVWKKTDKRVKKYIVSKRYKKGWFEEINEDFENIIENKFIDSDIKPNTKYYYKIYGIDVNSIKSEASIEVEVKSKKMDILPDDTQNMREQTVTTPQTDADTSAKGIVVPTQDFN